jgi:hypothetical protein
VKPSGSDVTLKATVVCTNILSPLPKEITQNENQYMMYTDNAYVTSPYKTFSQVCFANLVVDGSCNR